MNVTITKLLHRLMDAGKAVKAVAKEPVKPVVGEDFKLRNEYTVDGEWDIARLSVEPRPVPIYDPAELREDLAIVLDAIIEEASAIGAPCFTIPPEKVEAAPQTLEIYGGVDRSLPEKAGWAEIVDTSIRNAYDPDGTPGLNLEVEGSKGKKELGLILMTPAVIKQHEKETAALFVKEFPSAVYKQPAAKLPKDGKRGKSKRAYRQAGLAALELEDIARNE